jgi:hypothetical protein
MGIVRNAVAILGCLWLMLMGDFKPAQANAQPSEPSA